MFIGSYFYSIDSKGRISIPAKLRKYVKPDANSTFILTRNADQCIDIYPSDFWKELVEKKLSQLNMFIPEEAQFLRTFLEEASEDTLDSQYRLTIPKRLVESSGIENEVLILGALNKIEVWKPQIYEEYKKKQGRTFEDIAKEVMKK